MAMAISKINGNDNGKSTTKNKRFQNHKPQTLNFKP
jgi:hypothetical protein